MSKLSIRLMRLILIVSGGVYLALVIALAFFENSLVYPGSKYPRGHWQPAEMGYTEVPFQAADGTKLFGWYLPAPAEPANAIDTASELRREQSRTILYCHGNGENIAQVGQWTAKKFSQTLDSSIFIFDYRGFGKSEGRPKESGIQQDAEAALKWVCKKDGVKPADIILVGSSLGGGPACFLAKKHGCKVLVLQRTFSSLPDAAAASYPLFPVHWIMQNRMDSAEAIKSCSMPLFQSHGEDDRVIPIELGKKLHQNSPAQQKRFLPVKGMGHNDRLPESYWPKLESFVDQVFSDPQQ